MDSFRFSIAVVDSTNPKWKPIGAGLYDPVAVASEPGRIVLIARNGSGELVVLEGDGVEWGEGQLLGIPIARALDGHLYHARWDGGWDRG